MIRKEHRKKLIKWQVTDGNKKFTTFPTITKQENISLITDIKFLRAPINYFAL